MADRFQRLFTLTPNLYTEGCPVIIEAGALLKDTESGVVLAQLKMRNIGEEVVSSCRISIKAFATNGDEVEGVSDFSYLDLNASRGSDFGTKVPVFLPDRITRSFSVEIYEIVFADGTVQKYENSKWESIPEQILLQEYYQNNLELVEQYNIETNGRGKFLPEKKNGLFLCACGAVNLDSAEKCYGCNYSYDTLRQYLNTDYLLKKRQEREVAEEEKTQISNKKKERNIEILVVLLDAIAVMLILFARPTFAYNMSLSYQGPLLKELMSYNRGLWALAVLSILSLFMVIVTYILDLCGKRPLWHEDTLVDILPALPLVLIVIVAFIGRFIPTRGNFGNSVLVPYALGIVVIALTAAATILSLTSFIKKNKK